MNQRDVFFTLNPTLEIDSRDLYDFDNYVIFKDVEPGTTLLGPGDACLYLPFVLQGDLKVHRTSENGREVVLYHLGEGESCILSALGILNDTSFPASAVTPSGGSIVLIPDRLVKYYIEQYPGWRNYIFSMYNSRFHLVLELIDEILFRKIDVRLARYLLNHCDDDGILDNFTHQKLAEELGSSREVISRVLKSLSERKVLTYQRNEIRILSEKELKKLGSL